MSTEKLTFSFCKITVYASSPFAPVESEIRYKVCKSYNSPVESVTLIGTMLLSNIYEDGIVIDILSSDTYSVSVTRTSSIYQSPIIAPFLHTAVTVMVSGLTTP